jgi:hypothetical protein
MNGRPMSVTTLDLHQIARKHLDELCADRVAESALLELKEDLPAKTGRNLWHTGGSFGDYARNEIAAEIVAFANTFGGTVVIGIKETSDKPSRADAINLLPRVHDLDRSLRQAIQDVIDPPLPLLESIGVDCDGTGGGVVIIRVPSSRRKPHRLSPNREVYVRRMDESVRISMREIQELTIQSLNEGRRIDDLIANRREEFRQRLSSWLRGVQSASGAGLHFIAAPTSTMDLGRVAGRPGLIAFPGGFKLRTPIGSYNLAWPFYPNTSWTPKLRSIASEYSSNTPVRCEYAITTGAVCELGFFVNCEQDARGLFAGWLSAALGVMLIWIDQIRTHAQIPSAEFVLAPQIVCYSPVRLADFNEEGFQSSAPRLPSGVSEFPLMSIGSKDEFPSHLQRFNEDVWNLAGRDVQARQQEFIFID